MPTDPSCDQSREVLLTVRPAVPEDARALADLYLASRDAAYPAIPRGVHPPEEVRRWVTTWFDRDPAARTEVWLAEEAVSGQGAGPVGLVPVGLLLVEEDWLHSVYVAPGRTGGGIGTLLLDLAKSLRPHGLGLWVFETNHGARRFYARHGFVEVRRTDGRGETGNEEQEPDLELAWPDVR